jgi:hypothetical protein
MSASDTSILRELAEKYMAVCNRDVQQERRDLWRKHNSFTRTRPLIYTRAFAWSELLDCVCEDPLFHGYEERLRHDIYWDSLNDDSVFEPWISVDAVCQTPPEGVWGLQPRWITGDDPRGGKAMDPPIRDPEGAKRMVEPHHVIDEEETARRASKLHDAIGDIIPIHVERATVYRNWNGDISTLIAQLRGLDQFMLDMMERPDWLHELLAFMRDGILQAQQETEDAGDWTLSSHENQAMPYTQELEDPAMDGRSVTRDKLWYFCASQETTLLGPDRFDEFMFQYQKPIMEKFGLSAYGCCEDLTLKIDVLRQLPNLRRIAVSPMADVAKCAEQIGTDYIFSYRPSPSDMVGYDFDEDRIRRILRRDLDACRGCHVDITLKDVQTVQGDPARVPRWVEITREIIEEM